MIGIIYKITNKLNRKIYIGFTTLSLDKRFKSHCNKSKCGSRTYLHNAIRKYGKENFLIEEIKQINYSQFSDLSKLEIKYIKEYKSRAPNGYNLTDGGEGTIGWIPSKEFRKKLRKAHLGRKRKPFTDEHKRKIGEASKKRITSNLTRKRLRKATKGKNNPMFGKHQTEETKKKISDAFEKRLKSTTFINKYGKIIEILNLRKFCMENNIFYGSLFKVKAGTRKSHLGYRLYVNKSRNNSR